MTKSASASDRIRVVEFDAYPLLMEGNPMRKIITAVVGATFILAGSANAQGPSQSTPPAASPQRDLGSATIKSVSVVDLDALPAATQVQVNQVLTNRSAGEIQQMRAAIENEPELKSALAAKGFTSRDVVVAQLGEDGMLTIVAKRAS